MSERRLRRCFGVALLAGTWLMLASGPGFGQGLPEGTPSQPTEQQVGDVVTAPPDGPRPGASVSTGEEPPEDGCGSLRDPRNWPCRSREAVGEAVGGAVVWGVVTVFDQLYEWVAAGAAWLMGQLVSVIDSTSRPQVTAGWFAGQYRSMGGVALALMLPLLLIATLSGTLRGDWRGVLRSYFVYLPAAVLGTAVAVPVVDMTVGITDWMSAVFLEGLRGEVEGFLSAVRGALGTDVGVAATVSGAAPFLAFVVAAIVALGALAVWIELVLRSAGIYVALFLLPLGFAALVWPVTRRWYGRLVKLLAALILSKFVIVAVIALAAAALGGGGVEGFGALLSGGTLMLMAAFAPALLLRIADVAGDEMAGAVAAVTQHRTSPVPTPAPAVVGPQLYARMMNDMAARDSARLSALNGSNRPAAGAGKGSGAHPPTGPGTAGAGAAGAAVVAGAAGTGRRAGEAAARRLDDHLDPPAVNGTGRGQSRAPADGGPRAPHLPGPPRPPPAPPPAADQPPRPLRDERPPAEEGG